MDSRTQGVPGGNDKLRFLILSDNFARFHQSTHPHHKHVPPDIKHNRIPAPGLSFTQINLPFLIREIEEMN